MNQARVVKKIDDTHYEVEIIKDQYKGIRECGFGLQHDYAFFDANVSLPDERGATTDCSFEVSVHIPIKAFNEVALPMILKSPYTQPDHLADRAYEMDDASQNPPKYKKGDKYPAYTYQDVAIKYFDKDKNIYMVSFNPKGDREWIHMPYTFYNKYIRNNELSK